MGNTAQYWSPNVAGFSFRGALQMNETKSSATATAPVLSPWVWGASAQYDRGGLSLRYAYEEHWGLFGMSQLGGSPGATFSNGSSKDRAHKVVALWRIGSTRLTGLIEQLEYKNRDTVVGAVDGYKRRSFWAVVEQRFGAKNSVWFSYGRAEDGTCTRVGGASCNTHALGADMMTLGWVYRFSRRSEVFITIYRLQNKENAQYSTSPVVAASGLIAPGADTKGVGAGMFHTF